uniref:hypothetical protein n=1 Tax=Rhodococcus oryzae TaxID=2571143 RepID=UPI001B7FCFD7|nr:hypothetical protein [Rhodococcus oryzae]
MTEQLGLPVRYERRPLDELHAALVGYGLNEAFIQGVVGNVRRSDCSAVASAHSSSAVLPIPASPVRNAACPVSAIAEAINRASSTR